MLCQRGRLEILGERGAWGYDLKVDGIRCLLTIQDGEVFMHSRSGEQIANKFPEVVEAALDQLGPASNLNPHDRLIVLDGELVVLDHRGLPDWPATHKRQAAGRRLANRYPATYMAFDILQCDERDFREKNFWYRREQLESHIGTGGTIRTVPHTRDGEAMWAMVQEHELEGMVAKRLLSLYREGRSRDWLKIKRTSTVTCLVGGHEPGTGSRAATFGALNLYLLDDANKLVEIGPVGSGFSDRELVDIRQLLDAGQPFIVEVGYLDVTPGGRLRQPVFLRVRTDIGIGACTLNQLSTEPGVS